MNNFGGLFTDFYPTAEGTWNPGAGFNTGAYNNPTANKLMEASAHGGDINAVKSEATYISANPPVFFMPDYDYLLAVNSKNVGSQPDGWTSMTQQQWYPQYWYQVK